MANPGVYVLSSSIGTLGSGYLPSCIFIFYSFSASGGAGVLEYIGSFFISKMKLKLNMIATAMITMKVSIGNGAGNSFT